MIVDSPVLDQGDVDGTPCATRAEIEGSWSPKQSNTVRRVVSVERRLFEEGLYVIRKLKLLIIIREGLLTLSGNRKPKK